MHIVYSLDKNPYPQLLDESKQVFYLTSHCTKKSHTSHIGAQVMCKRIDLHSQMIYGWLLASRRIIGEEYGQVEFQEVAKEGYLPISPYDILAP